MYTVFAKPPQITDDHDISPKFRIKNVQNISKVKFKTTCSNDEKNT